MKKILSVLLVFIMTFSLVSVLSACGGGDSSNLNEDSSKWNNDPYAALKAAEVGDYVVFGSYEQGNGKEPLEWLVLDVQDGRILVISKYILDYRQYDTKEDGVDWESCCLREWLNRTFFRSAFSKDEQAMIPSVTTELFASDNVFLLSADEADRYFRSDAARMCDPTSYADGRNNSRNADSREWWLRTKENGYFSYVRDYVDASGEVWAHHAFDPSGVRPAMWIDLNS